MKRIILILFAIGITAMSSVSMAAMSNSRVRKETRFLTDKMAYELNLNDQQYNDAYEINLDYLMNIRTASDASSVYLEYRNADLRFILYDWQYALFQAATYFFHPVIWRTSGWFLPVYTIYSPSRFYYSPPRVYQVYRGGHYHYRHEHRQSFYAHRRPVWIERGKQRPVTGPTGPTSSSSRVAQRQRQPRLSFRITRQTGTTRPTSERPPRQWFPS